MLISKFRRVRGGTVDLEILSCKHRNFRTLVGLKGVLKTRGGKRMWMKSRPKTSSRKYLTYKSSSHSYIGRVLLSSYDASQTVERKGNVTKGDLVINDSARRASTSHSEPHLSLSFLLREKQLPLLSSFCTNIYCHDLQSVLFTWVFHRMPR